MYEPTKEQEEAVDKFQTGDNLKINAFAGTGKTATLEMLGQRSSGRGLYLAFNRSIADDASRRFPANVKCQTTHSLAFRSTPSVFRQSPGKMANKMYGNQIVDALGLRDEYFAAAGMELEARSQGFLISHAIRRYAQSADRELQTKHVPVYGRIAGVHGEGQAEITQYILARATNLWRRMISPTNAAPLGHDGYLKLWALSSPRLPADFVLVDEAQDTNPAVLGVLKEQEAQVVYVGDRHQQIYEWRGAVNAMERVKTPHEAYLTKSFRFGLEIAAAATKILKSLGETRELSGNSDVKSYVGCANPDTILSRTNAEVIATVIDRLNGGQRVYIVAGPNELVRLLEGVSRLKKGRPTSVPEFFGFTNWRQVVAFSETVEGEHLKTLVNLEDRHGATNLIQALRETVGSEEDADVIASTAHKAKGREWDQVRLTGDFVPVSRNEAGKELPPDRAELRLFYVAATRGRIAVDIDSALCDQFGIERSPMEDAPPILVREKDVPQRATHPKVSEWNAVRRARDATSFWTGGTSLGRVTLILLAAFAAFYLFVMFSINNP